VVVLAPMSASYYAVVMGLKPLSNGRPDVPKANVNSTIRLNQCIPLVLDKWLLNRTDRVHDKGSVVIRLPQ